MRISVLKRRFETVKHLFGSPLGPDAKPLEIRAAVVDAIEARVEPIGGGRRAFPGNRIIVRALARTAADRSSLEVTFANLNAKVRERLQEIRCDTPHPFDVSVSFLKKAPSDWADGQLFSVDCQRAKADPSSLSSSVPCVRINVLKGTATRKLYTFTEATILMGRTADVKEPAGRGRRNHVAFEDANSSVSRAHARLTFDRARGQYQLLDDGSLHGTLVVRRGETIHVPRRDPRGILVQSGDEIQLGDATIRVVIGSESAGATGSG
jgi:FHA domain